MRWFTALQLALQHERMQLVASRRGDRRLLAALLRYSALGQSFGQAQRGLLVRTRAGGLECPVCTGARVGLPLRYPSGAGAGDEPRLLLLISAQRNTPARAVRKGMGNQGVSNAAPSGQ